MPYKISITACLTVATTPNRCIFAFMQCAALAAFICPIPMFKDGIDHDYRIRHVEINPSLQYPIPNNFFTKNCPCSVCGLRPPETKKKNISTLTPQGQKRGAAWPRSVASLSPQARRASFDPTEPSGSVRCAQSVRGSAWLAQSEGGVLWRCTESVLPHPPTESVCGDTGRSGGVLWRCSHTQSHTQSRTQSNVRFAQSIGTNAPSPRGFARSPSRFARSPPSRTPKIAHLRPYRDTLSLHFVPDLTGSEHTPSLTAGAAQGVVCGSIDTWFWWRQMRPHWTR